MLEDYSEYQKPISLPTLAHNELLFILLHGIIILSMVGAEPPRKENEMLSGHLTEKEGKYYAVLNCKHQNGKRFPKWVPTKLPAKKGYKRQAESMLLEFRGSYSIFGESPEEQEQNEMQALALKANAPVISALSRESRGDVLFADYMLSWLSYMETEVDPLTYAGYCDTVENHIYPYFKKLGVTLSDLDSWHIKDYYLYERKGNPDAGKAPKKGTTVVRYHANIHKALEDAVEAKIIKHNAAHKQRPATDTFIGNFYLPDEALECIRLAQGTKLELIVLFGFYYGLRRSEIVGLKWQNFDFANNTLTIAHTVTTFTRKGKRVHHAKDKAKNKSSLRTLPLLPLFKEKLLALREQIKENRKLFGNCYNTKFDAYVNVDPLGELIKPDYISATFPLFLVKNGMRRIRFHDTRHSCASMLLKNGVSMKQIQAWLGHSDYATTANLYAHLDMEQSLLYTAQQINISLGGTDGPHPTPPQPPLPAAPALSEASTAGWTPIVISNVG